MADGSALGGMDTDHIYSLFDNALSNAIEAVSEVTDADKRYIGLQLVRRGGMISLHVENYFSGEIEFDGDMPRTTKDDGEWHGFGMRSMRRVVDAYGGGMSIDVKDDLFSLNVFLSPEGKENAM